MLLRVAYASSETDEYGDETAHKDETYPAQARFFRLVLDFKRQQGVPPTVREAKALGGFSSTRSVIQFLDALEAAGYIERARGARNIRFVAVPPREVAPEYVSTVLVPLVGRVAAGTPILAEDNIEDQVPVSRTLARPPFTYYLLRVQGDSMDRAGIRNGDLVLVRQQPTADSGQKVVALLEDGATVKYFRPGEGAIALSPASTNPRHKPLIVDQDFAIQGVVVATLPSARAEESSSGDQGELFPISGTSRDQMFNGSIP